MTAALPRALALGLTLLVAAPSARADQPVDGGVPTEAAPPPAEAASSPADTLTPPSPPKPSALVPLTAAATATEPPHARPTPLHRSALFWTAVVLGAGAVAAIAVGIGLAATYHPRYALVTF